MSSPWHKHQCAVPLICLDSLCRADGAPWAPGHTVQHLCVADSREAHSTHMPVTPVVCLFDLLCTTAEDSGNRFLLGTPTSLLVSPQVKEGIRRSGELNWSYSVWQMLFNLFALKKAFRAVVAASWASDTKSFCYIQGTMPPFYFLPLPPSVLPPCQTVTNEPNQLITFCGDILPTQGSQCPCWQNTKIFKIPCVTVGVALQKPQAD